MSIDGRCAWVCLSPRQKIRLCERARVPHCEPLFYDQLRRDERMALREAAGELRDVLGNLTDGLLRL